MASELAALDVLSEYIRTHKGSIPRNANKIVSFSIQRYELRTLDSTQAGNIIDIYLRNVDRLRKLPRARKQPRAHSPPPPHMAPKMLDIPRYSEDPDSSMDIEYIAQRNRNLMARHGQGHVSDTDSSEADASAEIMRMFLRHHQGQPPQHAKQLVDFSCKHI